MDAEQRWSDSGPFWQAAFDQAWASWRDGCFGIGAVVVDADADPTSDRAIVARDRNRVLSAPTPGVLAGTMLAHAEINALARLPVGPTSGLVLYTTLEPCLLCAGAIRLLRVPEVRYAGADPMFEGMAEHVDLHHFSTDRQPRQLGPLDDPLGDFGSLLPLTFLLVWTTNGAVVDLHREANPGLVDVAQRCLDNGTLAAVAERGGSTLDALSAMWAPLLGARS